MAAKSFGMPSMLGGGGLSNGSCGWMRPCKPTGKPLPSGPPPTYVRPEGDKPLTIADLNRAEHEELLKPRRFRR
jgi:hypothetical protein